MLQVTPTTKPMAADQMHAECPGCHSEGMFGFHKAEGIPVHSCLALPNKTSATGYPVGDLHLGYCPICGFIANTAFNPNVHDYSTGYEESQGCSPTFSSFAESLAKDLVSRYGIRRKTILEIGCGKGEFLSQICRLGSNIGVGIDPSYVPGRLPQQMINNIYFIRELYSEAHFEHTYAADFICCRHTLEHIGPTSDFMRLIRQGIADRQDAIVFFEVPDVLRVLNEGAFWDIYYEHCSYFSIGSLVRLFQSTGFDVLEARLDFNDQYILLVARPSSESAPPADAEPYNDLLELTDAVARFSTNSHNKLSELTRWVQEVGKNGKVVLWGSGSKAVALLTTLRLHNKISAVVDINPYRHGKYMPGVPQQIVPPQFLKDHRPDGVIIMNPAYADEIRLDLSRMGVDAPTHVLR